ncbi:UNVERIFIED_CONTAM: ricin-type beta-trefoil lectin domain protein, partial [Pseudomonas aeruginosa]
PVVLNTCSNGASQDWTIADGKIVGPEGLCLDAKGDGRALGEPVVVAKCNGARSQVWEPADGRISGIGGSCLEARGDPESESIPVSLEH